MSAGLTHFKFPCGICFKDHSLRTCEKFLEHTPTERYFISFTTMSCTNCLGPFHCSRDCKSKHACRICKRRHHTLLHGAAQIEKKSIQKRHNRTDTVEQRCYDSISNCPKFNQVFVPTVYVKIIVKDHNICIGARAIFNSSITKTKISKELVERYKLKTITKYNLDFAVFEMRSHNDKNKWSSEIAALITDELPRKPYSGPINADPSVDFPADSLADIEPQSNTAVEIEIGGDIYMKILYRGALMTDVGHVIAEKTALGFHFYGPIYDIC